MINSFINNGIKIYSLSSGDRSPEFIKNEIKKNKNKENKTIDLLHDLEFSEKSDEIKISNDGRYICISGTYPPQIGIYDTQNLSIKHRRHFDEEVIQFDFLTDNYEKLVFLCKNRILEFHNSSGKYYKMKIPFNGRSIAYNKQNANLFISTTTNQIFNIDLYKGSYQQTLITKNQINHFISINPILPIFATGGNQGILELWDQRINKNINFLDISKNNFLDISKNNFCNISNELTSCCFSNNGLNIAIGNNKGIISVYDIRHNKALFNKDHCNDLTINKIEFLNNNNNINYNSNNNLLIASNDNLSIQIYSEKKNICSLQLIDYNKKKKNLLNNNSININSFSFYKNSGLCFIPCDNKKVFIYYIPFIGLSPKWCSFLDSLTEELEEKENNYNENDNLYDDYIFLTNEQVKELNIEHLKGSKNLISYLHGYYIPSKVYSDIKSVMDRKSFHEIKKEMIKKKLEKKEQMRIPEKNISVNKDYVNNLFKKIQKKKQKKEKVLFEVDKLLEDERFIKLFHDPEYAIETINIKE